MFKYKKSDVEKVTKGFENFGSAQTSLTNQAIDPINKVNMSYNSNENIINSSDIDNLHSVDEGEIVNHFGNNTILEYWIDTYKYNSSAEVVEFASDDIGGNYCVLNKTIFYPQGGGQPSDVGVIKLDENNYFNVTKCLKHEGIVRHYGDLVGQIKTGDKVKTEIDAEKRLENVNLHSAAHLIDYALYNLGINTNGGKGYSFPAGPYTEYNLVETDLTIDNEEFKTKLEAETDRLRLMNLPFVSTYIKDGEGNIIRTIEIDGGKSSCPCAGTHVKNTSEFYGKIVIRETKIKKGVLKVKYGVEKE
jgi:Ser-tRNA(Ala) deacylase AlaX